ncbi:MAG: DNA polymerase III subunit alpha [Bacteroidales bacterium]|nr:DNA polymerase III subunit alpha [Bacteroidales bacterium]
MYLIFDTETTGLPKNYDAPASDTNNWPRMVQLAWQLHEKDGALLESQSFIIKPDGYTIPPEVSALHGITTEKALSEGKPLPEVLAAFCKVLQQAFVVAGHNVGFDIKIIESEFVRNKIPSYISLRTILDTKELSTDFCALPGGKNGNHKWPTLNELHFKLFGESFADAHNAIYDVEATARCFFELIRLKIIVPPDPFTHLHVHTQYSTLDGAASIEGLIKKAQKYGMRALAITDHGNMFGAKHFHNEATKAKIKPILGCEAYMAADSRKSRSGKEEQSSFHLILLAKNLTGYHNLMKLISYAWTEGFYYKPRIDKELLEKYREGLICCSACLGGELPTAVMSENEAETEKVVTFFKNLFQDDYYIELQRHQTDNPEKNSDVYREQITVGRRLIELAQKHDIKLIATNDVHFIEKEDDPAHDRLLCIGTAKDLADPNRMRYTGEEYMKTQAEMRELFSDIPEAIANTQEIVDKIEDYSLKHSPIMPEFSIPESFGVIDDYRKQYPDEESLITFFTPEVYHNFEDYEKALHILFETEYLRSVVYEGAEKRYPNMGDDIKERIDFELTTIRNMGFPSYFLIVWDLLKAAREMGVIVGPGRGSAAGSVVAYALKITDIDPIRYNLLFERFLNPDRISMPDIDIDFDDEGRAKIMKWTLEKYGKSRVAHIITFGKMAAKTSIRDVARVQSLDLKESDRLAKMIPGRPGTTFDQAVKEVPELKKELEQGRPEIISVLENAKKLEGSIRNTGVHACGVIIGRDDLENYVPICTAKDSEFTYVTQYDGKHVEDIGLLKMDFLGLKTLSIIKTAIENIRLNQEITIDIDAIPLDDAATYELYSRGETSGLFQFESDGMKKYLKELKPTVFEDLIAMNALYRPGPMDYIPQFIARKHGREKITYPLPQMEEYLSDTYGITVYQEQVMLLSRRLADFTRGQSDSLRKAMGKKNISEMEKLQEKFFAGCEANGHDEKVAKKIWDDWKAFAEYAFNKSHATCYSYISYQTAYLKTHYPQEFMAAVLSHNLNDIDSLTFFIDECTRMGIKVLGPCVNESRNNFFVNKNGEIRFGLNAIKGVGESATEEIIRERAENGIFTDIRDFITRINLRIVNKRSLDSLAMSGGFDCFENIHRAQYFHQETPNDTTYIEKLIRYGNRVNEQKDSVQISLFGGATTVEELPFLEPPKCAPWHSIQKLKYEKDLTGFYISGHPLDQFQDEMTFFTNTDIAHLVENMKTTVGKSYTFAGIVSNAQHRIAKSGNTYGSCNIEDANGSVSLSFFSENYMKFRHLLENDNLLLIDVKVEHRQHRDAPELTPQSITLLAEAINQRGKFIQINLDLEQITPQLTETLCKQMKNKGNGAITFQINDITANMKVKLNSNKKTNLLSLARFLKANAKIEYKIR